MAAPPSVPSPVPDPPAGPPHQSKNRVGVDLGCQAGGLLSDGTWPGTHGFTEGQGGR